MVDISATDHKISFCVEGGLTMSNPNESLSTAAKEPSYKLYLASALGAFFLGFGDLLNNDTAATVLKMGEVIRQYIFPGLQSAGLIALIFLVIFGCCVSWVHRPQTRLDAFARGASVFAILAVATPYQPSPKGLDTALMAFLSPIKPVYAEQLQGATHVKKQKKKSKKGKYLATINVKPAADWKAGSYASITVRDAKTAKILATKRTGRLSFSISIKKQKKKPKKGKVLVEVEAAGFRRTSINVTLSLDAKTYTVPLEKSKVPVSIQRLYAPKKVKLRETP